MWLAAVANTTAAASRLADSSREAAWPFAGRVYASDDEGLGRSALPRAASRCFALRSMKAVISDRVAQLCLGGAAFVRAARLPRRRRPDDGPRARLRGCQTNYFDCLIGHKVLQSVRDEVRDATWPGLGRSYDARCVRGQ